MVPNSPKLFANERIDFADVPAPSTARVSDGAIDRKYSKGDARIVTEQARYPLPSIPGMIASGNYKLNPDFQRRHRWEKDKQSRLIESFIMNVPIPPIFLYEDKLSHYEVMDGLQRLTAIQEFYNNKLELTGLAEWPELNGRTYETLPEQVRRGVDRRYLSSIVLLHETAKDDAEAERLKQLVFERINSGGVKLEAQESRNAIYDGAMNRLCIKLARNSMLCKCWQIPEPDEREIATGEVNPEAVKDPNFRKMRDVELVLRFFAYRQRLTNKHGALEQFLDAYLKRANTFPKPLLDKLAGFFCETIELVYKVLGRNAFLLLRKRQGRWVWFDRPTTVVYDPLMFAFGLYLPHASTLISRRKQVRHALLKLYQSNYDKFEGRYTNLSNMQARNKLFCELLHGVVEE